MVATILVVEDEAAVRRLIVKVLRHHGYEVVDADSAQHALAMLESHSDIKLAILDMVMPGMGGLDLANELRCVRPEMMILYISGFTSSVAMQSIGHRSPEAVLLKPFGNDTLIARVEQLLSSSRPAPSAGAVSSFPPGTTSNS